MVYCPTLAETLGLGSGHRVFDLYRGGRGILFCFIFLLLVVDSLLLLSSLVAHLPDSTLLRSASFGFSLETRVRCSSAGV
ncbi:hypothetical protein BR93DRAFT_256016 [Coniochaeta sp. PMI_546]|nr:hypothetical protein BR93DRAFT_256016 [Coniochaeta sp. PMI_546]